MTFWTLAKDFKFKRFQSAQNHKANPKYEKSFGADYLNSSTFKLTYGDKLVWEDYRRNNKGQIPDLKTRKKSRRIVENRLS